MRSPIILICILVATLLPLVLGIDDTIPTPETHLCVDFPQYVPNSNPPQEGAFCSKYIPYSKVWIKKPSVPLSNLDLMKCHAEIENEIVGMTVLFADEANPISNNCEKVFFMAQCAKLYKPCEEPFASILPCHNLCEAVKGQGASPFMVNASMEEHNDNQSSHRTRRTHYTKTTINDDGSETTTLHVSSSENSMATLSSEFDEYSDDNGYHHALANSAVCTPEEIDILTNHFKFKLDDAFDCDDPDQWSSPDALPLVNMQFYNPTTPSAVIPYVAQNPAGYCRGNMVIESAPGIPRCETYQGQVCRHVYPPSRSVYVTAGRLQSEIEVGLQAINALFNIIPRNETECPTTVLTLLCTAYVPPCYGAYTSPNRLPLPFYSSMELCRDFQTQCETLLGFLKVNLPTLNYTCQETYGGNVCLDIPSSSFYLSEFEYRTYTYKSAYLDDVSTGTAAAAPRSYDAQRVDYFDCEKPLVTVTDIKTPSLYNGRCQIPCLNISFTTEQMDDIERTAQSILYPSLVGGVITLLTLMFVFKTERNEHRYMLYFTCCVVGYVFVIWLSFLRKGDGYASALMCKTETEFYKMEGFPLFQAIFVVAFSSASIGIWFVQVTDLFLKLYLEVESFTPSFYSLFQKEIVFSIFMIGYPILVVSALLVAQSLGGNNGIGLGFGFIGQNAPIETEIPHYAYVEWLTYYALNGVVVLLGYIAIAMITYKVFLSKKKSKIDYSTTNLIRFLVTLVILGAASFIVLGNRAYIELNRHTWARNIANYVACLLLFKPAAFVDSCSRSGPILPQSAVVSVYAAIFFSGIALFVCLVLTSITVWVAWFKRLFLRDDGTIRCQSRYSYRSPHSNYEIEPFEPLTLFDIDAFYLDDEDELPRKDGGVSNSGRSSGNTTSTSGSSGASRTGTTTQSGFTSVSHDGPLTDAAIPETPAAMNTSSMSHTPRYPSSNRDKDHGPIVDAMGGVFLTIPSQSTYHPTGSNGTFGNHDSNLELDNQGIEMTDHAAPI